MRRALIKLVWYADLGRSRVLGRLIGIVPQAAAVFTFLKVYGIALRPWHMVLVGVLWYSCEIILGYIYARLGLLKIETDYTNKHNPLFQKLEKEVRD